MNFRSYLKKLPASRRKKIETGAQAKLVDLQLAAIREAAAVTQASLATNLGISQAAVSRLESRDDMRLSTFQKYIAAMGGKVKITVEMPGVKFEYGNINEIFQNSSGFARIPPKLIETEHQQRTHGNGAQVLFGGGETTYSHLRMRWPSQMKVSSVNQDIYGTSEASAA